MIRAALIGLAMLAAAPAMAQQAASAPGAVQATGLDWLYGRWCGEAPKTEEQVCLIFTAKDDGSVSALWVSGGDKGKGGERSEAIMRMTDGRVTLYSPDQDSTYREVSRGTNELVMKNVSPGDPTEGDADHVTYRVSGDVLTIEFDFVGGRRAAGTYYRKL